MTDNTPKLIKVNQSMARSKGVPRYFVGITYITTAKAYKIAGTAVLLKKKLGLCSICGKTLSNPNSITLGIGPICAGNSGITILQGYTDADIEKEVNKIKIDSWFPKSCVTFSDTAEVNIPKIVLPAQKIDSKSQKRTKEIKYNATKKLLEIFFPYNPETVNGVKSLSGRKYNKQPKPHWTCPPASNNLEKLVSLGFTIPDELNKPAKPVKITDIPKHLQKTLFPYQKEGFQFLEQNQGRALIGDEMGLGKTIQALTYLEAHPEIRPAVIVTPASLKLNWAKECKMWMTDYNLFILKGKTPQKDILKYQMVSCKGAGDIIIINYDILSAWTNDLIKRKPQIVITDECHFYKTRTAKRTKAVQKISKHVKKFIALSGTPITNRPIEFFNVLNIIDPLNFGNFWAYAKTFCGAKKGKWGWDFTGATNTKQLFHETRKVMIRRKKDQVLKELPPKIRSVIPMELDNRAQYEKEEQRVKDQLKKSITEKIKDINDSNKSKANKKELIEKVQMMKNAEKMMIIEKLKQVAVKGKMKASIEWISEHLETNGKLVVFATHTDTLNQLQNHFKNICVRIDGKTNMIDREKAVENFQNNNEIKLFLGNIKAAGVGLTLTAANATCFLELGWTPGDHDQAEDRVHRIGQEADSVHAYYLLAYNTIEDDISELLDKKRQVLDAILDGKESVDSSLLTALITKIAA